jgi:hypothetical protein
MRGRETRRAFFFINALNVSMASGAVIVFFAAPRNFYHAHARDSEHRDHDTGSVEGTR